MNEMSCKAAFEAPAMVLFGQMTNQMRASRPD
jgi:hypothetical protein